MSVSKMKKLTVLAYSTDADAIIRKLMKLRCVDIRGVPAGENTLALERFETDHSDAEARERLAAIRAVMPLLSKYSQRKFSFARRVQHVDRARFIADGRDACAWETVVRVEETRKAMDELSKESARNEAEMTALLPWLEYDAPLNATGTEHTELLLGSVPGRMPEAEVCRMLEDAGAYVEPVLTEKSAYYLAVSCYKGDSEAVGQALASVGFVKAGFPQVESTAEVEYQRLEARQAELENESVRLVDTLQALADNLDDVEILSDIEETTVNVGKQKQKLLRTRNCAVLAGWTPENMLDAVTEALSAFECACEVTDPEEGDDVPVLLKNNKFSQTFEWVIGMYSYPKYGTYDPTLIMSIFYFLIFGLMFADVGYGLLMVIGCFGGVRLLNPKPGMRRMLLMFGYCGISCMLMGVLFGGWFGNLPTAIMNSFIYHQDGYAETTALGSFFANGLLFNPINASTAFLVVALAVGQIHLMAGMAINMVETWKKGSRMQALCITLPYWVLFAGVDMMAPNAAIDMVVSDPASVTEATRTMLSSLSGIGFYLFLAGLALILLLKGWGEKSFFGWLSKGLGGWYSLISFASDLLSYSRILALGLVAGVIAQVINMMTGLGTSGPIGFIFMLIVMILGHILNIAINLLGTFVHAARLQYIEFFGKFYEDGGSPFDPALPAENYSEDLVDVPNEH